jgi:hypothetical protein
MTTSSSATAQAELVRRARSTRGARASIVDPTGAGSWRHWPRRRGARVGRARPTESDAASRKRVRTPLGRRHPRPPRRRSRRRHAGRRAGTAHQIAIGVHVSLLRSLDELRVVRRAPSHGAPAVPLTRRTTPPRAARFPKLATVDRRSRTGRAGVPDTCALEPPSSSSRSSPCSSRASRWPLTPTSPR